MSTATAKPPRARRAKTAKAPRPAKNGSTFLLPSALTLHPLVEGVPNAYSDEDFEKLVEDIAAHGIRQPVLIDAQSRILDGRNRWRAAIRAERPVPVIRTTEGAQSVVLQSLLRRRHVNKGALCFLVWPLVGEQTKDGRAESSAKNIGKSALFPNDSELVGKGSGKSVADLAVELGVSWDYLDAARFIHAYLARRPEERAGWETKILTGEVNLLRARAGVASADATKGGKRTAPEPDKLAVASFQALGLRLSEDRWKGFTPVQRTEIAAHACEAVAQWPEQVREAVLSALAAAD